MNISMPRFSGVITGKEIFRVASLLLYAVLLLHVGLVAYVRQLVLSDMGLLVFGFLSLLFFLSLLRFLRPDLLPSCQGGLLIELTCITGLILLLTLQTTVPAMPLPWLIGIAGIFPLALHIYPALASVAALAILGSVLNLNLDLPPEYWLPSIYAMLFVGLLAILLSKALRMNLAAMHQAQTNDRRFNAIARAARHVFMIIDENFMVKYVNPALYDVLGYAPDEFENQKLPQNIHSDDIEQHRKKLHYLRQRSGSRIFSRHRTLHKDGHWVWLETRGYNMLHDSAINGLVFSVEDISARMDAEIKLEQEHALLRTVLDINPSMIYAKDVQGRFTISNASFQRRFGYNSEEELRGKTSYEVFQMHTIPGHEKESYQMADILHQQDMQVIQSGQPIEDQEIQGFWGNDAHRWYRTNKYPLKDVKGTVSGVLGITRDITDRKEYEMRLEYQALHDPLTGLPNRRYLLARIGEIIGSDPLQRKNEVAMLFCDLDFFKNVNDIHGHEVGDKCLLEITRRINEHMPSPAFVGRFGGDEFVILMQATVEQASNKASALLHSLSQPIEIADITVKIQASIGIAQLTPDHKTPSDLIRDADAAMYQAKERGRNRLEMFDASLQLSTTRRARMDIELRFALERNELELAFQPKVSMRDGMLQGFELLLRWNSPQYGYIAPDEFIPIAEHSGQLIPIGMWALEQACRQMKQWHASFPAAARLTVAVNVSMRQLMQNSFVQDVASVLERTGVAPASIELELTESSAMANPRQSIESLSQLKKIGLRLALDDFGTGYSSLAYLQRLPIDVLKIDKAFVLGLGRNKEDAEIVRLILALAKTLNLETVAEGVETARQIEKLTYLGCHLAQGYAFSPAISANEAEMLLSRLKPYPLPHPGLMEQA